MLGKEEDLEGKTSLNCFNFAFVVTLNFSPTDQKRSKVGVKVGKGSHGSSNAYMLVYSRRDDTRSDSPSNNMPTNVPPDPASILPRWVQSTLNSENENFDAWNRDTAHRKVCHSTVLSPQNMSFKIVLLL